MSNIVWITSYPKSGNTWMRLLLTAYFSEPDRPVDLEAISATADCESRRVFEDTTCVPSSDLPQQIINATRPAFLREFARTKTPPYFVKTHEPFRTAAYGEPLITNQSTKGVVYLVRNPLDVLLSYTAFLGRTRDYTIKKMANPRASTGGRDGGIDVAFHNPVGRWSDHVASWLDQSSVPVKVVRYEDLLANTQHVFADILAFSGLSHDADTVAAAVERCSFDGLQKNEQENGFSMRPPMAKTFFRKGKSGQWPDELAPADVRQIVTDHGAAMKRLGYLAEAEAFLADAG